MAELDTSTTRTEDASEEASCKPSLAARASVAVAETVGWLTEVDKSIVEEFRRNHPVLPTDETKE